METIREKQVNKRISEGNMDSNQKSKYGSGISTGSSGPVLQDWSVELCALCCCGGGSAFLIKEPNK